ncbi:hypothetical protein PInf_016646 [Phytophthora infestans]|nr:hypothetical protein PInf_016646 [Phytophthora infestans]
MLLQHNSRRHPSLPAPRRGEGAAESISRPVGTRGVSDRPEAGLADLTTSHESDAESAESSRVRHPSPLSLPGDTTSGANSQSSSAALVSLDSLMTMVTEQGYERREELTFLARLMAYELTRSVEPSDPVQRRAILQASSAGELLDILKGNYVIGDLRADNQAVQEENRALTRRLDTLALSSVDLSTQLSLARQQVSRLEVAATQSANLLASLRKAQGKVEAALSQAQLHHQQVLDRDAKIAGLLRSISERDAVFVTLQGIASKHFERLQESVQLYSSTGTQPLRHAQLSRFPEALNVPAGESRRLELIGHPRQGAAVTGSAAGRLAGPNVAPPAGPASSATPSADSAAVPVSSATAASQPEPAFAQLHRTPLADLTSTQRLRRYANSKSPTVQVLVTPYACPLPGEEEHEAVSALLRSSSPQATMSDGGKPRSGKSRRRTRRKKVRHLQLSSAIQPAVSARSEDDDEASSEVEYEFEISDPADDTVLTSVTPAVSVVRPSLPASSAALTSPSGRPIRRSAATARTVTAQLLGDLDASDDEVLGPGDGSSSAAEDARRSAKARSLHAAIFGSDDDMSDESLPPSDRHSSRHSSMYSGDGTTPSTSASTSGKQQRRKRRAPSSRTGHRSKISTNALTLPLATLRTRDSQAVSKDCRLTLHMAQLREVSFMHFDSARCWNALLDTLSGGVQLELVGGKGRLRGDSPLDSAGRPIKTGGQLTRYFVALYERRHWIVESSVLMGLHPDVNPTATPAQLAEVYELWLVYKRERKRRSDTLRSLVVAVYDQLYSAVTQKLGDGPAPLVDAEVYFDPSPWRAWWLTDPAVHPYNTCFRARNVDFLVFAPRGMDPQVVDDAIEEDFDLAEQAPPAYAPGDPTRLNRQGIHIFTGSSIGELGSDDESASDDDSADDGRVSKYVSVRHSTISGTDPPQPTSAASGPDVPGSGSASLASSAMILLATAANVASPSAVSQGMTSATTPRLQSSIVSVGFNSLREARRCLASQTRPRTLMQVLGDMWVKLRGDSPLDLAGRPIQTDGQMTRYFVALYERRHWIVESSVLMGLHPDVNPAATPAQLAEVYELWLVYKRERKRRSDTLRSLVVAVYDQLYSAVTQKLGDGPAPLVDAEVYFDPSVPHYSPVGSIRERLAEPWRAWWLTDPAVHPYNTCFRARNVDFLVFAPRGMDPQVVDDAIEEDFDLAEQAPPAYAPGDPTRLNRQGIYIFTGSSIGELGSDDENASDDDSADDGRVSEYVSVRHSTISGTDPPNLRGASPSMSLFGTPLPSGTDPPQPTSAESGPEASGMTSATTPRLQSSTVSVGFNSLGVRIANFLVFFF